MLDQALGLLDHHVGNLDVTGCWLVEGGGDHFTLHHALHLGHFFRTLVDQQDDKFAVRVVVSDALGDVLQQHGLTGLGRCDDEATLTFTDGGRQIQHAGGDVFGRAVATLHAQTLVGVQGGQVFEQDLVAGVFRTVVVDVVDLEQREVALTLFRRPDLAGDGITGTQVEAADLARGDIDVIRACQIGAVCAAQEAKAVGQDFQHTVAKDILATLGVRLEDREDDVFLVRPSQIFQPHGFAKLYQLGHRSVL
ncbi:hypothetical protein D3C85_1083760 [compost metagenome]